MKKKKTKFKFKKCIFQDYKNGECDILCSKCNTSLKGHKDFSIEEIKGMLGYIRLGAQYCEKCSKIRETNKNKTFFNYFR